MIKNVIVLSSIVLLGSCSRILPDNDVTGAYWGTAWREISRPDSLGGNDSNSTVVSVFVYNDEWGDFIDIDGVKEYLNSDSYAIAVDSTSSSWRKFSYEIQINGNKMDYLYTYEQFDGNYKSTIQGILDKQ
jgi:hypothetical protein